MFKCTLSGVEMFICLFTRSPIRAFDRSKATIKLHACIKNSVKFATVLPIAKFIAFRASGRAGKLRCAMLQAGQGSPEIVSPISGGTHKVPCG